MTNKRDGYSKFQMMLVAIIVCLLVGIFLVQYLDQPDYTLYIQMGLGSMACIVAGGIYAVSYFDKKSSLEEALREAAVLNMQEPELLAEYGEDDEYFR